MPELPEVECLRRSLLPHLLGAKVLSAVLLREDVCEPESPCRPGRPGVSPAMLLEGATIADLHRRGKHLAVVAGDGRALGVHLGMTGQLRIDPAGAPRRAHTHAQWTIAPPDGRRLAMSFHDPRRFGGLWTFAQFDTLRKVRWADLGPDALTIQCADLFVRLRATRRAVKAALLDQRVLAGVGNIYADEALFRAGVRPTTRADRLSRDHVDALARVVRAVLAEAIKAGGSTLRDYADADGTPGMAGDRHRVYGRGGQPCVACHTTLRRLVLSQRTTVYCPRCQPAGGTDRRTNGAGGSR